MAASMRSLVAVVWVLLPVAFSAATEPGDADLEELAERARGVIKDKTATADDRTALVTELAKHPTAESATFIVSVGVAAAAAATGDASAIVALRSLAQTRCFGASLACRRGLIETLTEARHPAAVEVLVDMLQGLTGEARGDVITYLSHISGEHHGTDAKAWRTWFDAYRDALALDGAKAAPGPMNDPPTPAADDTQADYYDIPIYADRVVFMIDTSSSMRGAPLEAAKRELESAIFAVTRRNAGRYVSVNTISIMGGGAFFEDLAKANNGSFRAVNR